MNKLVDGKVVGMTTEEEAAYNKLQSEMPEQIFGGGGIKLEKVWEYISDETAVECLDTLDLQDGVYIYVRRCGGNVRPPTIYVYYGYDALNGIILDYIPTDNRKVTDGGNYSFMLDNSIFTTLSANRHQFNFSQVYIDKKINRKEIRVTTLSDKPIPKGDIYRLYKVL